jgi:hypothetical protein
LKLYEKSKKERTCIETQRNVFGVSSAGLLVGLIVCILIIIL